jgi:hypothetical protein
VVQPLPNPAEDDGRKLSEQYAPDEVADFLAEEGIPPPEFALPDDVAGEEAHPILAALWRWGSEGRRMVRRFVGCWLDDRVVIQIRRGGLTWAFVRSSRVAESTTAATRWHSAGTRPRHTARVSGLTCTRESVSALRNGHVVGARVPDRGVRAFRR